MSETPTTVIIDFLDDSDTGFKLAAMLLMLGYNVYSDNCPFAQIREHPFFWVSPKSFRWSVSKDRIKFDTFIFTKATQLDILFIHFVIGTWGTIRGNRYQYNTTNLVVTEDVINNWIVHYVQ